MKQGAAHAFQHLPACEVISLLKGVKKSGSGWVAQCPAHEDQRPSLSINEAPDGRVLLHCHANCSFDQICTALRIDSRSLGPDVAFRYAPKKPERRIVATYDYLEENGNLLFQVVRYYPKSFTQRRPDGKGGWAWNLKGVGHVLFGLLGLLAADPETTVFIVEGEKDAGQLAGLGLLATTNAGGVGKWKDEYSETLRGRQVVIVPDNDKPGHKHAEKVATSLHRIAASVRVLFLPNLPEKGDVSDWFGAGGTPEQFRALAAEAPAWKPQGQQTEKLAPGEVRATDLGNARRLVSLHGQDLHYCYDFKRWLVWDNQRWQLDSTGAVLRLAKDTVTSIYSEAAEAPDEKTRTDVAKWALRSEAADRIVAMLNLAQSEPTIPVEPKLLDTDPMLLNCTNGTLDLRSGELREYRREDYITKMVAVGYDRTAECQVWDKFLDKIMNGNAELIAFLRRAVGYSLTGDVSERVLFMLYGKGANGKSVFTETIQALLADYALRTPTSTLLAKRDARVGCARLSRVATCRSRSAGRSEGSHGELSQRDGQPGQLHL
ncbi:MAG: hypothetical protein H0V18_12265 [Pyrinomonadaceae bacterium]|jgi:putative DNA primase/helicase|nr:hypothetical protein [Pyrinomonadaceae bacterium]